MRRFVILAASAVLASAVSLMPHPARALTPGGPAGVRGAIDQIGSAEPVARVCREVCDEFACRRRCHYRDDRGYRRHRWGERHYYRDRHHDRPGVGLEFRLR